MSDTHQDTQRGLFVVRYNYNDNTEAREQALPAHESFLRGLQTTGDLALGGPLVDEPGVHAMLIVRATSLEDARELLAQDPMLTAKVLESREITGFIPAFGGGVQSPKAGHVAPRS
ncbi:MULTISPECIES: YciI family protein [unclassified Mycobacterium]|uniref:YciI family protein n=1 Tax=unclassified Mycobacterium TaxID=2642494 RepID=UPI000800FDC7|nr:MULTISPECIES: YciI family protein [unclassified Mycobacterium]OBG77472.1 hypothetical protein A5700_19425 [Mycobacterium sp. E1214]OBH26870.1 hypothetical protein A5693_00460 [Mycobacterium sp. E1319]